MIGCGHLFSWGGQLCLSSNQIAGFLDHQNVLKESTDIFDFLHGDNHQGKVVAETTSFVGCGQFYLASNQTAGFFDHQYLWSESHDTLVFLHGINRRKYLSVPLFVGCGQSYLSFIQIAVFFYHLYLCFNQSINLLDFLHGDNH